MWRCPIRHFAQLPVARQGWSAPWLESDTRLTSQCELHSVAMLWRSASCAVILQFKRELFLFSMVISAHLMVYISAHINTRVLEVYYLNYEKTYNFELERTLGTLGNFQPTRRGVLGF